MTENGTAVADDDVKVAKNDKFRVEFYQGQLGVLLVTVATTFDQDQSRCRPAGHSRAIRLCGSTACGD